MKTGPTDAGIVLSGPFCEAEVSALGGMVGPAWFHLPSGAVVQPFAVAPWSADASERLAALPPLLRNLRGEWPCVPFGNPEPPAGLSDDWAGVAGASNPDWHKDPHGYSANHRWTLDHVSPGEARLEIDYPEDHPVEKLIRHVKCSETGPRLDFTLEVALRRDTVLPLGLHPVFRLPDAAGAARLKITDGARAWTFPVEVEPGRSAALPDQRDVPMAALRSRDGLPLDVGALPFARPSEDLLLLTDTGGSMALVNREEGYEVTLDWDAGVLGSCLLWISNGGRDYYPWNGRFRAIGIEPVSAPFDLGPAFAASETPLSKAGIATGVTVRSGETVCLRYGIECTAIPPHSRR